LQDPLENLLVIISLEWRIATKHDIKDDTQAPHITGKVIGAHENLWGHIVWSPYYRVHFIFHAYRTEKRIMSLEGVRAESL
jgi:hypothetical protein